MAFLIGAQPSVPISGVRALSLDITGTLITHREPVMKSYADAAVWARLPDPPSISELKPAFKQAYKEALVRRAHIRRQFSKTIRVYTLINPTRPNFRASAASR